MATPPREAALSRAPDVLSPPTTVSPETGRSDRSRITPVRFTDLASFWRRRTAEVPEPAAQAGDFKTCSGPQSQGSCASTESWSENRLGPAEPDQAWQTSSSEAGFEESPAPRVPTPVRLSFATPSTEQGLTPSVSGKAGSPLRPSLRTPSSPCRRLLLTPKTGSSAVSYTASASTSIATPESTRRLLGDVDGPDEDNEMELALELVNHVPPEVADRLIDRLREAEAARMDAEERCILAEERLVASARLIASRKERPDRSCLYAAAMVILALAVGAAYWLGHEDPCKAAAVAHHELMRQRVAENLAAERQEVAEETEVCSDAVESDLRLESVCDVMLKEAEEERQQLLSRRAHLQQGFGAALEAVSEWLHFLHAVWTPEGLSVEKPGRHAMKRNDIEAHCFEAARPGRELLEELSRGQGPPPGRLAEEMQRRLVAWAG